MYTSTVYPIWPCLNDSLVHFKTFSTRSFVFPVRMLQGLNLYKSTIESIVQSCFILLFYFGRNPMTSISPVFKFLYLGFAYLFRRLIASITSSRLGVKEGLEKKKSGITRS